MQFPNGRESGSVDSDGTQDGAGIRYLEIGPDASDILKKVVREGESVYLALDEMADSLPGPVASIICNMKDSSCRRIILTPVRAEDGIIGFVSVSSPALDNNLVRSVEALSRHIGIAIQRLSWHIQPI